MGEKTGDVGGSGREVERTDDKTKNCVLLASSWCHKAEASSRPAGEGSEQSAAAGYERREITGAEGPTAVVSKQTGRKQLLIVFVLMRQQWRAGEKKAALIAANKVTVTITRRGLANTDEESLLCGTQVC